MDPLLDVKLPGSRTNTNLLMEVPEYSRIADHNPVIFGLQTIRPQAA